MNKNDLNQISKLLDEKLDIKLTPIHNELKKHGIILEEHGKELKKHGKLLRSLKKDQDIMSKLLDSEQMQQRKRLTNIEKHIGINPVVN